MQVLFNFTLKSLFNNKKRTLFTFLGIVLASSLLFGVGLAISTYYKTLINETIRNNGSHHIEYRNIKADKLKIIKKDNEVKKIVVKQTEIYELIDNKDLILEITSLNINYNEIFNLIEGQFPKNNNELIIPFNMLKTYKVNLGETIILKNDQGLKEVKIVGVFKLKSNQDYLYNQIHFNNQFVTFYELNNDNPINVFVTLKSPKYGVEKLNVLTNKLELDFPDLNFFHRTDNVIVNNELLVFYGQIRDAGVYAVLVLSAILIIVVLSIICFLIIYNSFMISVTERKRELGKLISIGATPLQIIQTIFLEVGIISLIAIPIGFIISVINILFSLIIINFLLKDIIYIPIKIYWHPFFILLSLTGIIFAIFMASLIPAIEASDISPFENIKLNKDFKFKRRKGNSLIFKILKIEGLVAYKNIKCHKRKYRTTIISIVISIVLFILCSAYLKISFVKYNNIYFSNQNDVYLKISKGEHQKEIINKIKNLKDVKEVLEYKEQYLYLELIEPSFYDKAYLKTRTDDNSDEHKFITVYTLSPNTYKKYKEKIGLTKDQPILVNYKRNVVPKEVITEVIEISEGKVYQENKNLTFNFCNYKDVFNLNEISNCYYQINNFYFTDYNPFGTKLFSPFVIVNKETFDILHDGNNYFNKNVKEDYGIILELKVKKAKRFHEEFFQIFNEYLNYSNNFDDYNISAFSLSDEINIEYNNYKLTNHANNMTKLAIQFVFYSLCAFINLIGIVSFINTINTNFNLRKKEFAMFRSLGQPFKSFTKMITLESLFISFKALFYGFSISALILYLILKITSLSYGINQIVIFFPKRAILFCAFLIPSLIYITMKWTINNLTKENLIDTIKNESI